MPIPQRIARFNKVVTNRVTGLVAGRLRGFGILTHRGRKSGRAYTTPINVFDRPGGVIIALTYGQGDWVKNVLAAGEAEIRMGGRSRHLHNPRVVEDPSRAGLPAPVRAILGRLHVHEFLWLDDLP